MAIEIQYRAYILGGAVAINSQPIVRSGSSTIGIDEPLPAAQAGTLTTRTGDAEGVITMSANDHTIEATDVVDIYWNGGVLYGVTVDSVSTVTALAFNDGDGDVLPADETPVLVVPRTEFNVAIDGDAVVLLAAMVDTRNKTERTAGHIQFVDGSGNEIAEIDLVANEAAVWDIAGGTTNPFTGSPITKAYASTASTAANSSIKISGVADASP